MTADCPSLSSCLESVLPHIQAENQTPPEVWGAFPLFTLHRATHPSLLPSYTTDDAQACKAKHQNTASDTCSNHHIAGPSRSFLCGRREAFKHRNKRGDVRDITLYLGVRSRL